MNGDRISFNDYLFWFGDYEQGMAFDGIGVLLKKYDFPAYYSRM